MQRLCAILLLALFGIPLIVPAMPAQNDSKVPSCCRREGKHHCGMANVASQNDGPAVKAKCPYRCGEGALPALSNTIVLNTSQEFYAAIAKHPAVHSQTEARRRISFSRSRQKRGPPLS